MTSPSPTGPQTGEPIIRLSICIATFKRGDVIRQTLDCICEQLTPEVEVVIVDGNSPDNTQAIVGEYQQAHPNVRYFREATNSGVDQDFDKTVGYARGDYCWLMTDDDLIERDAVQRILTQVETEPELIVVDAQVRTSDFSRILQPSRMYLTEDREFAEVDDAFLELAGDQLSFIGSVIIRRSAWLCRDRTRYYGSLFIHVGVILQTPPLQGVKVLARPMIQIRYGNAMWTPRSFEIWMLMWPQLIWGFDTFTGHARQAVCPPEPWRQAMALLKHRAKGSYTPEVYTRFIRDRASGWTRIKAQLISLIPAAIANFLAVAYVVIIKRQARLGLNDLLESPHASKASVLLSRMLPLSELSE